MTQAVEGKYETDRHPDNFASCKAVEQRISRDESETAIVSEESMLALLYSQNSPTQVRYGFDKVYGTYT